MTPQDIQTLEDSLFDRLQEVVAKSHASSKAEESGLHKELLAKIANVDKKVDALDKKVDPVLDALTTAGNLKKFLIEASKILIALTASVFSVKQIIDLFSNK